MENMRFKVGDIVRFQEYSSRYRCVQLFNDHIKVIDSAETNDIGTINDTLNIDDYQLDGRWCICEESTVDQILIKYRK